MKKYFIPVLLLSILAIGGCSVSKNVNTNSQNTNQPQDQKSNQTFEKITNENFSQGGLTDLEIGKKVMVMGKQNTDGTIVANQIIIANSDTDFSQFGSNRNQQQKNNADNTDQQNAQGGNQQPNAGAGSPNSQAGNRPNSGQFQNLSEEERTKLRTQMGNRQSNGNHRQMNRSMSRLNGEITAKDDTSITLKLQDGSAKLVFVSGETFIDIIKQPNE